MKTPDALARKMAAWLLMLPGPWPASSLDDALRRAAAAFDPRMDSWRFDVILADAGYELRAQGQGTFAIVERAAITRRAA